MKTKKKVIIVLVAVLVAVGIGMSAFLLTGCNNSKTDVTGTTAADISQSPEECYTPNEVNIVYEDDDESFGYVNNMVLVFFSSDATDAQISEVVDSLNGQIVGQIEGINQYQIQVKAAEKDELEQKCEQLLDFDVVQSAVVDYVSAVTTDETPNDPWKVTIQETGYWEDDDTSDENQELKRFVDWDEDNPSGTNWWFEAVKIPSAWDYSDYFSNIKVGVVDNGFDTEHEDLNITVLNNDVNNYEDHGTHVSGIIGSTVNNNKGISGIVKDVSLYGVDCYPTFENAEDVISKQEKDVITISALFDGIVSCVENKCKVINLSSGAEYTTEEETKSKSYELGKLTAEYVVRLLDIYGNNFIVFQSAGNGDGSKKEECGVNAKDYNGFFAAIDENIAQEVIDKIKASGKKTKREITAQDVMDSFMVVGAVDCEQKDGEYQLSSFSNYGDAVTVCAPGVSVLSTVTTANGSYGYMSGTSMAAPIVSGITALVWSVDQNMSSGEVKQIITETATQKVLSRNKNDTGTYFMVNAKAAVEKAVEQTTTTQPTTAQPTTAQPTTEQPTTQAQDDVFSQMPGEMIYTSGAGAWACTLNMNSDGSFTGTYIDDDMGIKGDEYPNGTRYYSTFSGKFTVVEKVDDYTYSVKLENLQLDNEPDSVEYKDGLKFVYTDAVGLSGATGFYICVPGKSMSEIPNDVKLLSERLYVYTADTLSDYLLYGTTDNGYSAAFVSYAS